MSFLIHYTDEGMRCKQGINWRKGENTKLCIIIKLWRFIWYFRLRAPYLCKAPNSCKKIVFKFSYLNSTKDGFEVFVKGFEYSWNARLFRIENKLITEELLFDMIASLHNDGQSH